MGRNEHMDSSPGTVMFPNKCHLVTPLLPFLRSSGHCGSLDQKRDRSSDRFN